MRIQVGALFLLLAISAVGETGSNPGTSPSPAPTGTAPTGTGTGTSGTTPTPNNSTPTPENPGGGSNLTNGGNSIVYTNGTLTPGTPGKLDMVQKSKAASVAAKAAAQGQQAACNQMMNNAMMEKDKEEQKTKLLMAMMQCQQANQSQQSAKENEQNSEKGQDSKEDKGPKGATLTMGTVSLEESNTGAPQIVDTTPVSPSINEELKETPLFTMNEGAPEEASKGMVGSTTVGEGSTQNQIADPVISALSPIPAGSTTTYDENQGSSSAAVNATAPANGLVGTPSNGSNTAKPEEATSSATSRGLASSSGGSGGGSSGGDGYSQGGSSGTGDEGGSKSGLDALVAQLMDPTGGAAAAMGSMGMEVIATPEPESALPRVNIFEYASFRYSKAVYEDGRVKRPKREPVAISAQLSTSTK